MVVRINGVVWRRFNSLAAMENYLDWLEANGTDMDTVAIGVAAA